MTTITTFESLGIDTTTQAFKHNVQFLTIGLARINAMERLTAKYQERDYDEIILRVKACIISHSKDMYPEWGKGVKP